MRERLVRHKRMILHYYVAAVMLAGLFTGAIYRFDAADEQILFWLLLYLALFPVVLLYTRKYALHIFLFLLAFLTGFYSFYHYSVDDHSVLNALYFTFKLYVLDMTDVFTADGTSPLQYPFVVEIARWSAAMYTISTLFIAMYRMLEMSILLVYYQVLGKHYVVIGYDENAALLIDDLRRKKKRVIVLAENISNETAEALEADKVVVIRQSPGDISLYAKCGIDKATAVLLFARDEMENLDQLISLQQYIHSLHVQRPELRVFLHLKTDRAAQMIDSLLEEMKERKEAFPFAVEIRNIYQLFAEKLLQEHPVLQAHFFEQQQQTASLHYALVGFGQMGTQIAKEAIRQNKQMTGLRPMRLTALDRHMPQVKTGWETDHQVCLDFHTVDVTTDSLHSFLDQHESSMTAIFICLHEDSLDYIEGIELSNRYPATPIFLQFQKDGIMEKWLASESVRTNRLYSMGTFADVLTAERYIHPDKRESAGGKS